MEHNIHSNNYPQRDDVTCLFNFVWTGVRLILSLIVPQPCPFKESLLSFGSRGSHSNPIMVIDWWLRSNTWSTHTGSGHIHILRQKGRQEECTNTSLAKSKDTTSWDSLRKIFLIALVTPPLHTHIRAHFLGSVFGSSSFCQVSTAHIHPITFWQFTKVKTQICTMNY